MSMQTGITQPPRNEESVNRRVLLSLLIITALGEAVLGVVALNTTAKNGSATVYGIVLLIGCVLTLTTLLLAWRGITLPARVLTPVSILLIIDYIAFSTLGLHDVSIYALPLVLVLGILLLGDRATYVFIILIILSVIFLGYADLSGLNSNPIRAMTGIDDIVIISILTLMIAGVFRLIVGRLNDAVQRLQDSQVTLTERNLELQELSQDLEKRVAERTQALDRRAVLLQAAADVGAAAARFHDLDELLGQVTNLISKQFGFYHVGIFLRDEQGEYAVLRATNSEGGKRMLARGHRLKIGQIGIVGYVTGLGEARIALDVGQDAVFFDNPDLPETRSELALPLIVSDKILGALDVQSTQAAAFSEVDITTLKVLADQVAIAIENARLFAESQTAMDNLRRAYGEISRSGWERLLREHRTEIGYISLSAGDVAPVSEAASPESLKAIKTKQVVLSNDGTTLHLPIEVRGEAIGTIRLDKPASGSRWTSDDTAIANSLAEQLGTALESARLYDEISQRAEREYAIADITSKIGASVHFDSILHATVQELAQVFKDSEIILQIEKGAQG